MNFKLIAALSLATLLTAGAVMAQSAPADLVSAYKAGVAAAKCDLGLDAAKESALGDAVQRVEQKSGLAQDQLDALWSDTQAAHDADAAGVCGRAAGENYKTSADDN